jgi:probable addiction module antidote protein
LDEGEDAFLLALRDVAQARGGLKALSQASGLNRENLYDMLSTHGNPRFSSIKAVLDQLGMQVSFRAKLKRPRAA